MKKILYLDCGMGVAGDMLSAAFLDLLAEMRANEHSAKSQVIQDLLGELNAIGIPKVTFEAENAVRCGILGLHLVVRVSGEEETVDAHPHPHTSTHSQMHTHTNSHSHSHRTLADVLKIIEGLKLPKEVRSQVISIYQTLAEAESHAHGMEVSEIHFHEVGLMDAIADITASAYLLNLIHPDQVIASPVRTGFGEVHSAHGILPVPAPATAFLLRGIPTYAGNLQGEMSTPTGAALLKTFVSSFEEQPVMTVKAIGYGMGKKEFPRANCLRAIFGEADSLGKSDPTDFRENRILENYNSAGQTKDRVSAEKPGENISTETEEGNLQDQIIRLECDIDDMTGEELGFAMDRIYEAGAREVFYSPIQMKKNRPGILLTVLTRPGEKENVVRSIFSHTTTIGIREEVIRRYVLKRSIVTEETAFGPVRKKVSEGYGVRREKWEYEDLKAIAKKENLSIHDLLMKLPKN
ncbi:nickel pincer cofactor biosynthesis protein LarC [Lachnospiraceae bacterium YH-ros2228]